MRADKTVGASPPSRVVMNVAGSVQFCACEELPLYCYGMYAGVGNAAGMAV